MKTTEPRSASEHDDYWKDAFDQYLPQLLELLAPDVAAAIDWSRGFTPETHGLAPDAIESKTGTRYPDRVYRVIEKTGDLAVLFLHFEFESGRKNDVLQRVTVYRMRLFLKLRDRIFTLVFLLDGDPNFRPNEYVETVFGNELRFRFHVVKLLDFAGRETEFLESGDPAKILIAIKLVDLLIEDPDARLHEKKRILNHLATLMRRDPRIRALTRYLIHGIMISRSRDREFHAEVMKLEQEYPMPFVTIYEREAEARGEARGEALAILNILAARFGTDSESIRPRVESLADSEVLLRLVRAAATVDSLDAFLHHLPSQHR